MFDVTLIPSKAKIAEASLAVPDYMRPNNLPWAVALEAVLSDEICDAIVDKYSLVEPYQFHGCNAVTRECHRPLDAVLTPAIALTKAVNQMHWNYDLDHDHDAAAWMQTYEPGADYALHMDASPGQMRKLTAVVMLSHPHDYQGGSLQVRIEPRNYLISKKRGTIVVFPSWLPHFVEPVTEGTRQTINLGFWGPNFR